MTYNQALEELDKNIIRIEENFFDINYKSVAMTLCRDGERIRPSRLVEWYDKDSVQVNFYTLPCSDTIEYNGEKWECSIVTLDNGETAVVSAEEYVGQHGETPTGDNLSPADYLHQKCDYFVPMDILHDTIQLLDYLHTNFEIH